LELQPRLAGGLRHRRDAAVIGETISIEDDLLDLRRLRLLRDELAHALRVGLLVAVVLALQLLRERRGKHQRLAGRVVHHLGVDVLERLVHRQPRPLGGSAQLLADSLFSLLTVIYFRHGFFPYAAYVVPVLPSLRRTRSAANLTPLPLYGSGGR